LSARGAIPAAERIALMDLYNSTNGPNWANKTNWLGAAGTECAWYGVTCDGTQTSPKISAVFSRTPATPFSFRRAEA